MKQEIFNQYATKVADIFGISMEKLFTKTKQRDCVDARHLLYYLCSQRPMRLTYIQKYLGLSGYNINHSSIHHGIQQVKGKVESDKDYLKLINKVEKCIL